MAATFGLDFGTTNSLISVIRTDNESGRRVPYSFLEDGRPHPSVVRYSGTRPTVGRAAMDQLRELGLGVFGDTIRSPKLFLGSSHDIYVGGVARSTVSVVADVLQYLRDDALSRGYGDNRFESAVITIPVTMDGRARAQLRQAAQQAGLGIFQFVHEPLAALYGYIRSQRNFQQELANLERRLVLVFDWGGGTLDLTLCQVQDGILTQILNLGDRDVGGDEFDLRLRQLVRQKHEAQHPRVNWAQLQPDAEARIIRACEDAKIALSTRQSTILYVPDVLAVSTSEKDLDVAVTRLELQEVVRDLVSRGLGNIDLLLERAGVHRGAVEYCLATGGMIAMPAVRDGLREMFGMKQLRLIDNATTVIAEGAAWIANDGVRLQLAKPIELLHANNTYVSIVSAGTELPVEGKSISNSIDMYCVDPSDGIAKFLFARPAWPGRQSQSDPRLPYQLLTLPVDENSRPLFERLNVDIKIDHNLIADIYVFSRMRAEYRQYSIHELEFGLGLRNLSTDSDPPSQSSGDGRDRIGPTKGDSHTFGAICARSNVWPKNNAWNLVPGDEMERHGLHRNKLTKKQHEERMYYVPCSICQRRKYRIDQEGCDHPRCREQGIPPTSVMAHIH